MNKFKILIIYQFLLLTCSIRGYIAPQTSQPLSFFEDSEIINDVTFVKLGTYRGFSDSGEEYQKSYFFSKLTKTSWAESKVICKSFKLELATIETLAEVQSLLTMSERSSHLKALNDALFWVDGVALGLKTNWFWMGSGKKVSFSIPWTVGQPEFRWNDELCLCFGKLSINQKIGFHDNICTASTQFVCQRNEVVVPYV